MSNPTDPKEAANASESTEVNSTTQERANDSLNEKDLEKASGGFEFNQENGFVIGL